LTFEGIFVVQKDFEKWTVTGNLGAATTISGVFDGSQPNETEGSLSASAGAVYDLGNKFKIGGEISAEAIFPDWSNFDKINVYAGPCVNWVPTDNIWVTAGVSYNVSGHTDEPRFIGGLIVGIYFTLGVFLWRAASNPMEHLSLIWFAVWSSVVHAAIMAGQALTGAEHHGHLVGDVPILFGAAALLGYLTPAKAGSLARAA